MSLLEEGLFSFLKSDAAISTLVSDRVYPVVIPQRSALPALSFRRADSTRIPTHSGSDSLDRPQIEINAWATSYLESKNLAAAVRRALHGFSGLMSDVRVGAVFFDGEQDMYEDEVGIFFVESRYQFIAEES